MIPLLKWRRSAAALTALAVALLGAAAAQAPAHAAEGPTLAFQIQKTSVGVPQPDNSGDPPQISWALAPPKSGPTVTNVVVSLDLSGISSFITADNGYPDDTVTWKSAELGVGGAGGLVDLHAKPGAALGTTGTAVLSGTADNATITPLTVRVTVGAVGLVVNKPTQVDHAKPGDSLEAPLTIANTGQLPADGADLRVTTTEGLGYAQHFSNCVYSKQTIDNGYATLNNNAVCHFATTIEPGKKYRLSAPVGIDVTSSALWDLVRFTVSPKPGTPTGNNVRADGPVLSLVPDGAAPSGGTNTSDWTIDTDNTADIAAGGDTVSGKPGDTVQVIASMRNKGPATVDIETSDDQLGVMFDVPKGTTVVKIPKACYTWGEGGPHDQKLGAPKYICWVNPPLRVGATVKMPFTLRIDADAPALATGTVQATTVYDNKLPFDPDVTNNTAAVTVHVKGGATATPTSSAGATSTGGTSGGNHLSTQTGAGSTAGGSSGTSGSTGTLASTGGNGTQLLTWLGAAALAFGAAAFALAHSRRTRRTTTGS
ncbi:LPXTG cell wall anchor domain-containing protein [Streptomyces sp. NBC_00669]|uniref:LPXTG cell wall anchor domain-containing protein n=1 Tax=Streptomyces sp. NBC_00669 TaxID=2976011 RepID=UPI002E37A1D8|nr:LPXTG cell wall anchor domain-containing protein [Streptomyces sp. NBC_00669]